MSAFADLIPNTAPATPAPGAFDDLVPQLKDDAGHQAAAGLLAFGQGGMPVFDEAGAGAGALLEKLGAGNITGGNAAPEGASLGDIYDKRLGNIRAVEKSFSDQHPVLDPALRVAGGIASIAALPGASEALAARPVATGAAYGAAQGFTGGTGGFDQRLGDAGVGAAIGAGGSLVADKLINPIISKAAPAIQDFLRSDSSLPTTATESAVPLKGGEVGTILKNLETGDVTPQQFADALRNSSSDDFAGEVGGEPLRMLTQNQAKITGPAMQPARDAMRQRLADAPNRAQAIIENTLMPAENVSNLLGNLDDIGAKLPELYDSANGQDVSRRAFLGVINTPAGQDAMKSTVEKLANQGINPADAGIVIDGDNGFHGLAKTVPVGTLQELSKSLGDQVERNPITGAVQGSDSAVVEGLRRKISSYLEENSPEFAKANANAAAQLQGQAAFDMGRKLAKTSSAETAEDLSDRASQVFSPNELSYQKAGFTQGLIDNIKGAPIGTGNPAARIAQNRVVDRIADLTGDPSTAETFKNQIMAEKLRMELAQRGLFGSNTPEMLGSAVPDVPTSASKVVGKVIDAVSDKLNAGSNQRLAKALYATTPEEKSALAAAVLQASGSVPSYGAANQNALAQFLRQQTPLLSAQGYGSMSGGQQ